MEENSNTCSALDKTKNDVWDFLKKDNPVFYGLLGVVIGMLSFITLYDLYLAYWFWSVFGK